MAAVQSIILLYFFIQVTLGHDSLKSPIVGIAGGHPVDIEDVPYMAALLNKYSSNKTSFHCGGSIINERFVLTAAHCVRLRKPVAVRVGSPHAIAGGYIHQVAKVISHPLFPNSDNDIALLKLSTPVTFGRKVAAVRLTAVNITVGMSANVSGWGYTGVKDSNHLMILRQVQVTVVASEKCTRKYPRSPFKKSICAQDIGRGHCMGDSGSPLTVGNIQIGIVSWGGRDCPQPPDAYVKVQAHLQWIHEQIEENSK